MAEVIISDEEITNLFIEFRNSKNEQIRDKLIMIHDWLVVRSVVPHFANRGVEIEDLKQVGRIGLINAVERYDPEKGVKFSTYAFKTIYGEIQRYFRDKANGKAPRKEFENLPGIAKVIDRLTKDLNSAPNVAEIAERAGISEEDVQAVLDWQNIRLPASIDANISHNGEIFTLADMIGQCDPSNLTDYGDLYAAIDKLDGREKAIVYLYYFKDLTQTEVARELGISQMHVSRLKIKILEQLKRFLENDVTPSERRSKLSTTRTVASIGLKRLLRIAVYIVSCYYDTGLSYYVPDRAHIGRAIGLKEDDWYLIDGYIEELVEKFFVFDREDNKLLYKKDVFIVLAETYDLEDLMIEQGKEYSLDMITCHCREKRIPFAASTSTPKLNAQTKATTLIDQNRSIIDQSLAVVHQPSSDWPKPMDGVTPDVLLNQNELLFLLAFYLAHPPKKGSFHFNQKRMLELTGKEGRLHKIISRFKDLGIIGKSGLFEFIWKKSKILIAFNGYGRSSCRIFEECNFEMKTDEVYDLGQIASIQKPLVKLVRKSKKVGKSVITTKKEDIGDKIEPVKIIETTPPSLQSVLLPDPEEPEKKPVMTKSSSDVTESSWAQFEAEVGGIMELFDEVVITKGLSSIEMEMRIIYLLLQFRIIQEKLDQKLKILIEAKSL